MFIKRHLHLSRGFKLMCKQHHGQKGPIFDQWALIYLDCCEAKGDEDGSWADCHLGTDLQAGLTAAQVRKRKLRRRESYACAY